MENGLVKAIDFYKNADTDKDGFVEHDGKATWMDTLHRTRAVEVQALWVEALKCSKNLFVLLKNKEKYLEIKKMTTKIESKLEKSFWNEEEGFYLDRIDNGENKVKTINSIFPLFFDLSSNPNKILKTIESDEFTSPFGVRSVSKNEKIFNPIGYHTGSVWGWMTALVACIEFKNNRPKKGLEYLKILADRLNQNCLGAIGEAWNSETGDVILLKPRGFEPGCCLQGWSSALVIRCIDECMLGIRVNAFDKSISVHPSLPDRIKVFRRKRIGNDFFDLKFERIGKKIKVRCLNNQKRFRIIFVE
jgi:glycogen debranching enzyme